MDNKNHQNPSLRGENPSKAEAISKHVDCFVGLRLPRNDVAYSKVIV